MMEPRKQAILTALDKWIRQRPGLEFCNYGEIKPYRAELRQITKDLHHARTLLRYVELRDSITADMLLEAQRAYSGRMQIKETDKGVRLEYCTGQYWPTEYRKVVCAILSQAIWYWMRERCMPSAIVKNGEQLYPHVSGSKNEQIAGDWMRSNMRREFGKGIQQRWFN